MQARRCQDRQPECYSDYKYPLIETKGNGKFQPFHQPKGDFSRNDIPRFGGELGNVLNHTQMVREHLGGIIQNVRNVANNLTTASGELDSITQKTQHDLAKQQSDIQQVATAMDQMSVVMGQVSQNAEAAARAAKKADQATIEGRSVVEQTINAIGGLAKDVEGASTEQSFAVIAEAVVAIAEMNQQIAVSSTEQSAVTEEIHRNISHINDLAVQTGSGAQGIAQSGERVGSLAKTMESLVGQFRI